MDSEVEMEVEPQKKAVYKSYLNYMMIPESTVYSCQTITWESLEETEEIEEGVLKGLEPLKKKEK